MYVELGGITVLVVTQGIDFIPVLVFRIPVYTRQMLAASWGEPSRDMPACNS